MVRLLREDGGIGLLQGDSGTGKTEAVRAVALRYKRSIVVQASTARARPKPMLEDIGQRMGISYYSRDTADTYRHVRERLPTRLTPTPKTAASPAVPPAQEAIRATAEMVIDPGRARPPGALTRTSAAVV